MNKTWGGRFNEKTNPMVEGFTSSLGFDRRLYSFDIQGSIAHAKMLGRVGLVSREESVAIIEGLEQIEEEIRQGGFAFDDALEDIHMNIEARLIQKIGPLGGKLQTARSRNDQVALDLRLYVRYEIKETLKQLRSMQEAILQVAARHVETLMPGYTHLQRAQPVSFAHHLLAYYEMVKRDKERFKECLKRVQVMPLGSGALSGTTLPIDRAFVAKELGFDALSANSLDAVSDRDFIVEFLSASSILMMHLSRLSEEIILWSSSEFRFIELPDSLCTGSSLMPQKKNPDPMELVRGKTGRVYGDLISLLVTLKGIPLSYNRDLQEDKEPLFDTVDTLKGALSVTILYIKGMRIIEQNMLNALGSGFLEATDLAEYLVRKGIPFRDAHHIVGRVVSEAIKKGWTNLSSFSLDELKKFSDLFCEDVIPYLSPENAAERKRVQGGTSSGFIKEALKDAQEGLKNDAPF